MDPFLPFNSRARDETKEKRSSKSKSSLTRDNRHKADLNIGLTYIGYNN